VSIKLVVSGSSKESRIVLVGTTGKELLASAIFTEPRAKGATLRALKKILGADVTIEDSTTTSRRPRKPAAPVDALPAKTTGVGAKSAAKRRPPVSVPAASPARLQASRRRPERPRSGPPSPVNLSNQPVHQFSGSVDE
jgi:hypothetical protein